MSAPLTCEHPRPVVQVIGRGRVGKALVANLRAAGLAMSEPLGRGATGEGADVVLLAVPDAAIADAAAMIGPGPMVGHLSGATTLEPLHGHRAFSLHPVMTITGAETDFAGAPAAVAGVGDAEIAMAEHIAHLMAMETFRVADDDRVAYHAACSMASNFVVTLEGLATEMAKSAGVQRRMLAPLARAAIENWVEKGAAAALTGPIARGDDAVVLRQREAVAARLPEGLETFDALARSTRRLACSREIARDAGMEGEGPHAGGTHGG